MKKNLVTLLALVAGLMSLQAASRSMGKSFDLLSSPAASVSVERSHGNVQSITKPAAAVKSSKSIIFQDDFESYPAFAIDFAPWTLVDIDSAATYSIGFVNYPNQNCVGSYMIWTPGLTDPPQTNPAYLPHSGFKSATCFNAVSEGAPNNDWLISPVITLQTESELKFWAETFEQYSTLEKFNVGISTGGTNPSDFTIISGPTATEAPLEWTEFSYDLSAYDGMSVRVAIQCVSNDVFAMQIDDFSILGTPDNVDILAPTVVSLTGNRVSIDENMNLSLVVEDQSAVPATIEAIYNIGGGEQTITMTRSTKDQYTYTGTIPASATQITGTVKFKLADLVEPPNTTTTPTYVIEWMASGLFGYGEGFEDDSFPPEGWTTINIDDAEPSWEARTDFPHNGTKVATHIFGEGYQEGLLILPQAKIGNSGIRTISFFERSKWPEYYNYHGLWISTTTNDAASFTELQSFPAAGLDWSEKTVDLSAYAGQKIYLAFKYTGDFADSWFLDDVKYTGATSEYIDNNAPVCAAPTGTNTIPGTAMTISTVVTDGTGIASVVGHYKLTGQTTWTDFVMTASKVNGTYIGTIEAQTAEITGKVKFTAVDTYAIPNSGESPEFDITWANQAEDFWIGNKNAENTSGLGVNGGVPWKLGVALDLGNMTRYISKISYMCNNGTAGPLNWSILSMPNATTWSTDIIAAGGELAATPIIGTTWNDVQVNSNIPLTGTFGLVIDLTAGGFWGRHAEGTEGKSYIFINQAWYPLGAGQLAQYTGDWTLKCYVTKDSVGISEEAAILPGKSELNQNYPNPFNPSTTINFFNNMTGNVKLTVMNAKGETVTTLINNKIAAGSHKVNFNGAAFNSGVYFYKLETPTAMITKKMLLVK